MKSYEIFNMGIVHTDLRATIKDLVVSAYKKYDRNNIINFDNITVYDIKNYKIILDNNMSCARAKLGDKLCIAYFVPNKFYYVEGGWGCHMIDMNAKKFIPHPITFGFKGSGIEFAGWPVINGNIRINEWIEFLLSIKLIKTPVTRFKVYPDFINEKSIYNEYDINFCGNKKIKSIKELESKWCTIIIDKNQSNNT